MKLITIIFSLLILSSCGLRQVSVKELSVHPELQKYLKEFESYYGRRVDDLKITFASTITSGNTGYKTLGYCQTGVKYVHKIDKTLVQKTPIIVINLQEWNAYGFDENERTKLIMHELGHCILKRGHSPSKYSLMYPYLNQIVKKTWNYWLKELFSKDNLVANTNDYTDNYYVAQVKMTDAEIIEENLIIETKDCIHDTGTTIENHEHDEHEQHEH